MAQNQNAIATISSAEIAQGTTFTPRQVDLIREQIMPTASDDELMLFAQVASSRGLDPFRKHIYAVSRRANVNGQWVDKWSYQVSIDGLRLIAERSGKYEGQTPPEWCGPDGKWTDIWLSDDPPAAARVGVLKKGTRAPIYATALYKTFVQRTSKGEVTKFWKEMPEHMLAKVAESQALRKAFPEEAGGLYTTEEMQQASNPPRETINRETGEIVEASARPVQRTTATVEPVDQERKKAAADLWYLARDTFGWDQQTLDLVAVEKTEKRLGELDTDGLQTLYMDLVGTSHDEREELVATVLGAPEQKAG